MRRPTRDDGEVGFTHLSVAPHLTYQVHELLGHQLIVLDQAEHMRGRGRPQHDIVGTDDHRARAQYRQDGVDAGWDNRFGTLGDLGLHLLTDPPREHRAGTEDRPDEADQDQGDLAVHKAIVRSRYIWGAPSRPT